VAIKGKGKTKSKGVARAPKRAPVPVPVPFTQRRWVQVTAALVVGFLAFWLLTWIIDGVQANRDEEATGTRRTILQEWQAQLESDMADVGRFRDPAPPVFVPQVQAAAKQVARGRPSELDAEALDELATTLEDAAAAVEAYPLADRIRDQGFGGSADQVLAARTGFVIALRMYRQAALLLAAATEADDPDTALALAERARDVYDQADALAREAHRQYSVALGAAGIMLADPPDPGAQFPVG
jgi:hypothetical protein